jgi:hypothetical protein
VLKVKAILEKQPGLINALNSKGTILASFTAFYLLILLLRFLRISRIFLILMIFRCMLVSQLLLIPRPNAITMRESRRAFCSGGLSVGLPRDRDQRTESPQRRHESTQCVIEMGMAWNGDDRFSEFNLLFFVNFSLIDFLWFCCRCLLIFIDRCVFRESRGCHCSVTGLRRQSENPQQNATECLR